ncbi:MAG: FkbM family methyltransferase [Dehalococcoidia bacterium]
MGADHLYVSLLDLSVSYALLTKGTWEPLTTAILRRTVKPGMAVVDIGAQLGYYTLLAARLVGTAGTVTAFEPDKRHLPLLLRSVRRNALQNVTVVPKAVFSRTGRSALAVSHGTGPREIDVVRLDDVWTDSTPKVDLIKMDIDGAEPEALDGMQGVLQQNPDAQLLVEYDPWQHRMADRHPEAFVDQMKDLGFQVEVAVNEAANWSGQADWQDVLGMDQSVNLLLARR